MVRHPNYLGDLIMALAWSLPCGEWHGWAQNRDHVRDRGGDHRMLSLGVEWRTGIHPSKGSSQEAGNGLRSCASTLLQTWTFHHSPNVL